MKPLVRINNNWNPFSAKPGLDFAAFVTNIVAIAAVEFSFGWYVQLPLQAAKAHVDQKQIAILYASWALASLFGFFFVCNTFIKRWAAIYGMLECPWWMKSVARLLLMSPLLSIWATLFTLMFSEEGVLFQDREERVGIVWRALATLFVFHIGFLGYRLVQKEITFRGGTFALKNETSMRDSLPAGFVRDIWLPGGTFYVHAYPYLSPLSKLALSVYGDFARTKILSDQVSDCASYYVGQKVPNCFLQSYREVAAKRPFVTPAFGLIFETRYRQAAVKGAQPKTPIEAFALNAVTVENLLVYLEPGDMVYDRKNFLKPVGLLPFYGSPELPAISIGQDAQKFVLAAKLTPMLAPQIKKLSDSVDQMKGALTPEEAKMTADKITELRARLKALESNPLAGH